MSADLEAKYAESDELSNWLGALEREGASLEAVRLVRAQLDRVLEDIEQLSGRNALGFSVPASPSHTTHRIGKANPGQSHAG